MNIIGCIAKYNQQLQTIVGKDLSSLKECQDVLDSCTLSVDDKGFPVFEKKEHSLWSITKQYLPSIFGGTTEKKAINASVARIAHVFDASVPKNDSSQLRKQINRLLDIFAAFEKNAAQDIVENQSSSLTENATLDTTNFESWSDSEMCSSTTASVVDVGDEKPFYAIQNEKHSSTRKVSSRYEMYQGHAEANTKIVYDRIKRYERMHKDISCYFQKNSIKMTEGIEKDLKSFSAELQSYKNLVAYAKDGDWNQIRQFKWVHRAVPRGWNDVIQKPKQYFFPLIASRNIWKGLRSKSNEFKKILEIEYAEKKLVMNDTTSQVGFIYTGCYQEEICGEWTKKSPLIYEKRYLRDEQIDYLADIAPLQQFLDDNAALTDKELDALNLFISDKDVRSLTRGNSSSWKEWKKFIDETAKMEKDLQELQSEVRNNKEIQSHLDNSKIATPDQDDGINVSNYESIVLPGKIE